jgi:hypothetical protein
MFTFLHLAIGSTYTVFLLKVCCRYYFGRKFFLIFSTSLLAAQMYVSKACIILLGIRYMACKQRKRGPVRMKRGQILKPQMSATEKLLDKSSKNIFLLLLPTERGDKKRAHFSDVHVFYPSSVAQFSNHISRQRRALLNVQI